jgi:hypothetical protein
MSGFNYENTETKMQSGGKVVRKVSIKKGRGYKSITKYHKGKKLYTVKKPIHKEHIKMIKRGKFVPGLFQDCRGCKTKKRRGGGDIEEGPEIPDVNPYPVPPDPERFSEHERRMRVRPVKTEEVEELFAGPTPEAKQVIEAEQMAMEDPLNQDPFDREELRIFSGEGGRRKRNM